jgi:hypothetical protein
MTRATGWAFALAGALVVASSLAAGYALSRRSPRTMRRGKLYVLMLSLAGVLLAAAGAVTLPRTEALVHFLAAVFLFLGAGHQAYRNRQDSTSDGSSGGAGRSP